MSSYTYHPTQTPPLTINPSSCLLIITTIILTTMILQLPPHAAMAARVLYYPPVTSAPSTALPLPFMAANEYSYATLKKGRSHGHGHVFHKGEVDNCMPKGMHRSSAPSRYVNYQTLSCRRSSTHTATQATAPPNP